MENINTIILIGIFCIILTLGIVVLLDNYMNHWSVKKYYVVIMHKKDESYLLGMWNDRQIATQEGMAEKTRMLKAYGPEVTEVKLNRADRGKVVYKRQDY